MTSDLPAAVIEPRRRLSLLWLVPLAAAALAAWLGYQAWTQRGLTITVQLEQGHGLKAGDEIRYRGIAVGEVRQLHLSRDLEGVLLVGRLHSQPEALARAGSRFWVVRPQLGLDRVAGLETLVGPRYLAVLPGDGPRQRWFIGLTEPPPVESIQPGDLEITLQTPMRRGLRVGAPVLYRQVRVGTILSVGLSSDAGAVEARAHVRKPYVQLIRPETRFWMVGGARASIGLGGLSMELDSLESLVVGGVMLATPPGASAVVNTGHRFDVAAGPQEQWLEWDPLIVVGADLLPPGAARPTPLRGTIGWREGRVFRSRRSRQGWLLPTGAGLLGPLDMLRPDEDARTESVVLQVAGRALPLEAVTTWDGSPLAVLDAAMDAPAWPLDRARPLGEPEDCLLFGDPVAPPFPLAAARLRDSDGAWTVDRAVALDQDWHGAAVITRSDGMLVGLLLIDDEDAARVAGLPAGLLP